MARAKTEVDVRAVGPQPIALLVLLKTPAAVPAKSVAEFVGSNASEKTGPSGRPALRRAQVAPPSVGLKTPFGVPAYAVRGTAGSRASADAPVPGGTGGGQVAPRLQLLKSPSPAPAASRVG